MLGVGEYNGAIGPLFFQQGLQQAHFLFVRRIEKLFLNAMAGFLFRFHFHIFSTVHVLKCQFTDAIRKGGREQHAQTLGSRRHATEQPANIFNKAEIEHAIGFVQHHNLNSTEINVILFRVVDQATGGCHQNINALLKHFQLFVIPVSAIGETQFQAG